MSSLADIDDGTTRWLWVDVGKALCMFAVFLGHTVEATTFDSVVLNQLYVFIYSFHIPLFFFLSGVTFKRRSASWSGFLYKNFFMLVFPAAVFVWLGTLLYVGEQLFRHEPIGVANVVKMLLSPLGGYPLAFVITWFLFCLFVSKSLFYLLYPLYERFPYVVILGLGIAGATTLEKVDFFSAALHVRPNFWYLHTALLGAFFLSLGHVLSPYLQVLSRVKVSWLIAVVVLFFPLSWFVSMMNHGPFDNNVRSVNLALAELGNPLLFFPGALLGIFLVVVVSIILQKVHRLQIWGQLSLPLIFFAGVWMHHLNEPMLKVLAGEGVGINASVVIVSLVAFCVSVLGARALKRYFPQLMGMPNAEGPIFPSFSRGVMPYISHVFRLRN